MGVNLRYFSCAERNGAIDFAIGGRLSDVGDGRREFKSKLCDVALKLIDIRAHFADSTAEGVV